VTPDVAQYSVVDAPERERFEIRVGDEVAGFTEYKLRGSLIAFVHTEVAPEHEGKGVASRLISGALDAARERGLTVLPFCPFVRGYIAKHPDEYLDLVPSDLRQHFELASNDGT
jgi:predicted GNAT family acetyltransferase